MKNSLLFIALIFSITILSSAAQVLADYIDPTYKVNVNTQTDLFKKSIGDVPAFERGIEGDKSKALEILNNEEKKRKNLEFFTEKTEEQIKSETAELSNTKALELTDKGRTEMARSTLIDNLYSYESNSFYAAHLRDAKRIANASSALMNNIMAKLKDLNVDCKTVKGPKESEPAYYIDIKREQTRDTNYNQKMCEELRNKYYCNDVITVKCDRKVRPWGEWQLRTIRFNGRILHDEKPDWGYAIKWGRKEWGWHITPYHPRGRGASGRAYGDNLSVDSVWRNDPGAIIADGRAYIARNLGVSLDQIREDVMFPEGGRGIDSEHGINPVGARWRIAWHEYEFKYYYRELGAEICTQWSEDWNETCRLQ